MTDRRTPEQLAALALSDSTVIATLIGAARLRLEQERGGYPTHTPGAAPSDPGPLQECRADDCTQSRPCPTHDSDLSGPDTPVERLGFQRDAAANDLDRIGTLMRKLTMVAAEAAAICIRWGLPGITQSDVKARLAEIDSGIWCDHCSRLGQQNVKRTTGEKHCRLCAEYKAKYHDLPTLAIFDAIKSRGGKLYVQDVARIRTREGSDLKRRKKSA